MSASRYRLRAWRQMRVLLDSCEAPAGAEVPLSKAGAAKTRKAPPDEPSGGQVNLFSPTCLATILRLRASP